jgi:hypothetical protein
MKFNYLIKIVITCLLLFHFNNVLPQVICIDSVLINGSIKKYMNYSDFISTDVKIDSIIKPDPMQYATEPDSVIYVGSSIFYLDSKVNRCDARTIWFDKIASVKLGKFLVNKSTTFNDLKMMFPTDCASTRPIRHYRFKGIIIETCSLFVKDSKGDLWDMRIAFYLKDDTLVGLDFWEPI